VSKTTLGSGATDQGLRIRHHVSQDPVALKGLKNGAYHECLGPWVKKILAGQNKLRVESASLEEIQSAAMNILVTSRFYQNHTILPRKLSAGARAAIGPTTSPSGPPPTTSGDSMMESVFNRIRSGEFLSGSQARWIRDSYSCIHCFSKTHGTESCHKLANLYLVTKHPGGEGFYQPPAPSTKPTYKAKPTFKAPASGGAGRKATEESGTPSVAPTPSIAFAPSVKPPGE
jgi:hypothetical protein